MMCKGKGRRVSIKVVDVMCPSCGAPEVDPKTDLLFVRGLKVHDGTEWCSHCMRCHTWFGDSSQQVVETCLDTCYCYGIYKDPEPVRWVDTRSRGERSKEIAQRANDLQRLRRSWLNDQLEPVDADVPDGYDTNGVTFHDCYD